MPHPFLAKKLLHTLQVTQLLEGSTPPLVRAGFPIVGWVGGACHHHHPNIFFEAPSPPPSPIKADAPHGAAPPLKGAETTCVEIVSEIKKML